MNLFPGDSLLDGEPSGDVRPAVGVLDKLFRFRVIVYLLPLAEQAFQQELEEIVENEEEKDVKKTSDHTQNPSNYGLFWSFSTP